MHQVTIKVSIPYATAIKGRAAMAGESLHPVVGVFEHLSDDELVFLAAHPTKTWSLDAPECTDGAVAAAIRAAHTAARAEEARLEAFREKQAADVAAAEAAADARNAARKAEQAGQIDAFLAGEGAPAEHPNRYKWSLALEPEERRNAVYAESERRNALRVQAREAERTAERLKKGAHYLDSEQLDRLAVTRLPVTEEHTAILGLVTATLEPLTQVRIEAHEESLDSDDLARGDVVAWDLVRTTLAGLIEAGIVVWVGEGMRSERSVAVIEVQPVDARDFRLDLVLSR